MKFGFFPAFAFFALGCGSSSAGRPDGDIVEIRSVPGYPNPVQGQAFDAGPFDQDSVTLDATAPYDGGQACKAVTACGGHLGGTWTYMSVCGDGKWLSLLKLSQPCAVEATPQISGTVDYREDGTYSQTVTVGLVIGWDQACLVRTGYGCNSSCNLDANGICRCPKLLPAAVESGTYVSDGTAATMTPLGVDAGAPTTFAYCVSGRKLYSLGSFLVKASGGMLADVSETGYVLAVKGE